MVAFSCQIARVISVAVVGGNYLACDIPVVPNPIPTSPFPIRAGGTIAGSRIISIIRSIKPFIKIGPSGDVSESVVTVGITTFCKVRNGKG